MASQNPHIVRLTPLFHYHRLLTPSPTRDSQIRALILENTFLSLPRLVPSALPILGPFSFLCHQKWDSASKIPLLPAETPMLLLSGVQDEVVPREHMQGLWELVQKRVPGGQRGGGRVAVASIWE